MLEAVRQLQYANKRAGDVKFPDRAYYSMLLRLLLRVMCALTEPWYGVEFALEQCECDLHPLYVLLHLSQLVLADCVELVEEVDGVDDEAVDDHQHLLGGDGLDAGE